jgi:hypothetical protein
MQSKSLYTMALVFLTAWTSLACAQALPKPTAASDLPRGVRWLRNLALVPGGHPRQKLDLHLPEKASGRCRPSSGSTAAAGRTATRTGGGPCRWCPRATPWPTSTIADAANESCATSVVLAARAVRKSTVLAACQPAPIARRNYAAVARKGVANAGDGSASTAWKRDGAGCVPRSPTRKHVSRHPVDCSDSGRWCHGSGMTILDLLATGLVVTRRGLEQSGPAAFLGKRGNDVAPSPRRPNCHPVRCQPPAVPPALRGRVTQPKCPGGPIFALAADAGRCGSCLVSTTSDAGDQITGECAR